MESANENHLYGQLAIILDKHKESARNTAFLLHLAGLNVYTVKEDAEALDWILKRKDSQQPFNLLVLSNTVDQAEAGRMIAQLDRSGAALPILVVERNEADRRLTGLCTAGGYSRPVMGCKPTDIIEGLRTLLQPSDPMDQTLPGLDLHCVKSSPE